MRSEKNLFIRMVIPGVSDTPGAPRTTALRYHKDYDELSEAVEDLRRMSLDNPYGLYVLCEQVTRYYTLDELEDGKLV